MTEDRSQELNRYWNAVVAGKSVADGFALDADDMATVRRLNHAALATSAGSHAEEAWPGVLARILATDTAPGERSASSTLGHFAPHPFGPNGRAAAAIPATRSKSSPIPKHLGPGVLMTAALVLLTLIAGLFTIGPLGTPSRDTVVPLPAVENTGIAVGHFEPLWQARGSSDQLDNPSDLAIDAEGRIWVVDASRGTIEIFAPDGTFLESWGGPGTGDGQFSFSSGIHPYSSGDIAFGPDGSIYVVDTGNVRVQKFAPDGRFLLSWGGEGEADGQFLQPAGIAVDPAGMVYVSDEQRAIIQIFDGEGRFLNAFGGLGVEEGQFILPQGMAVDPRGLVWVVDRGNNRLQQFDASGTIHAIVGSIGFDDGELNQPLDIAIDDLGRLYVAEEGTGRVQVLDQDGRALASVSGYADNSLFSPLGVAVATDGAVYVTDTVGLKAFRVLLPMSALLMP